MGVRFGLRCDELQPLDGTVCPIPAPTKFGIVHESYLARLSAELATV